METRKGWLVHADEPICESEMLLMLGRDSVSRKLMRFQISEFKPTLTRVIDTNCDLFVTQPLEYCPTRYVIGERAREILTQMYPLLDRILELGQGNIIVAGGAVARSLWALDRPTDADLFFVGKCDPEEVLRRVLNEVDDKDNILISRNEFTVTMNVVSMDLLYEEKIVRKYQFVLRHYPSIGHVLGGFDIQAAAVAYSGGVFYATEFGEWSCINRIILIDTTRCSTTYYARLRKYALNCIVVFIGLRKSCRNSALTLLNSINTGYGEHDYGYRTPNICDIEAFKSYHYYKNLYCLHIGYNSSLCLTADGNDYQSVLSGDARVFIQLVQTDIKELVDWICNRANDLSTRFNEYVKDGSLTKCKCAGGNCRHRIINSRIADGSLTYYDITTWSSTMGITRLCTLLSRFCKYGSEPAINIVSLLSTRVSKLSGDKFLTNIRSCFDSTMEHLSSAAKIAFRPLEKLTFITENPGRQWTSSFNPILTNPRDWYGPGYISTYIGDPSIERTLWRARVVPPFNALHHDIFRKIMLLVLFEYDY